MSENDTDPDQLVERTDTGVSITTTLKRGTGTRDEDKHVLKAKGHTLVDAISKHKRGMKYFETEVVDRARALQPEDEEGEDE